jgi:hypothetical protein
LPSKINTKTTTPAPGDYDLMIKWSKSRPKFGCQKKPSFYFEKKPPSIPSHENVFGYDIDQDGKLYRLKPNAILNKMNDANDLKSFRPRRKFVYCEALPQRDDSNSFVELTTFLKA